MAINKRKVLDAARKQAQKGAKQKALKEYNTLLKLDPRDAKLRLEIGDAHRRWGETEEAIGHYTKVADQYQNDGFDARAVAVFKQILNLDPKRYSAYVSLSELYQRMGLDGEAGGALQTAADGYHKEGKRREALELLRKMAQLDPTNTTSRLKVAELLKQEGLEDEAVDEYEAVAEELVRQGEPTGAESVYQRLIELRPKRADVLLKLARNAIEMRAPERAEAWAKRAAELMPDDSDSLETLCDVFKALERTEDLVDATRRLAKLYRDRGDEDMARKMMQRLPEVGVMSDVTDSSEVASVDVTDDALIRDDELLGDEAFLADDGTDVFELETGDDEELPAESAPAARVSVVEDAADEFVLDDEISIDSGAVSASASQLIPAGDPDQLLAEANVYLRYGKTEQAISSLEGVIAEEPGHRAALEKLGEALSEVGQNVRAVEVWSKAAERAREEDDQRVFDVLCARIEALDPDAAARLGGGGTAAGADESGAPEAVEFAADDAAGDDLADIEIDLDIDVATEAAPSASSSNGSSSSTTAQQIRDELEEAGFYFEQGMLDEAAEVYQRILQLAPNHPSAMLRMGEIAAARGDDPMSLGGDGKSAAAQSATAELDESLDFEVAVDEDDALESKASDDDAIDIEVDLDLDADEPAPPAAADSGPLSDPTLDAAVSAAEDVFPDTTDTTDASAGEESESFEQTQPIADLLDGAEDDDTETEIEAVAAAGSPVSEHADDSFDLAAELAGSLEDDDASESGSDPGASGTEEEAFASLFESFKKGVSETLGEGDYETRYDLAIAYKEMGLLDDAIGEFQVCVAHPKRQLDSLQMLAQCALDLGRGADAVGHLEQALSTDELPANRRAGLYFDLARAFCAAGDYARARTTYENVRELDPSFPGVEQALADLVERQNEDSAASSEDDTQATEAFESFDDLIADATAGEAAAAVVSEKSEAVSYESFSDVIDDAESARDEDPMASELDSPGPDAGEDASEAPAELAAEEAGGADASEPEPEAAEEPAPQPKPARKKRKISFV